MTNCTSVATDTGTTSAQLTYVLAVGDLNKYMRFEVTPQTAVAPTTGTLVLSDASGQIGAASSNLINNYSFEDDTNAPPLHWTVLTSGTCQASTGEVTAQQGSNIAYFTTLTTSIGGREVESEAFSIDFNKGIDITGYFRTPQPIANTKMSFKVWFYQDAACTVPSTLNASDTMTSTTLSASDTWEQLSYSRSAADVPDDASYAKITIRVQYVSTIGTNTDRVYFDNISASQP